MDDDRLDVKVEAGEEASISEPSPEEPKASGEVLPEQAEPTGEALPDETETEERPKKGAESRIRELNSKTKAAEKRAASAEEKAQSLEAKLAELTGSVEPQTPNAPYTPQIEPGTELSPDQYKDDVVKTAQSLVELRLKQYEAINRINSEATQVLGKYPELDPESESFDKELSDSITEATLAHCKANPYSASPKKFVEQLMKPYKRSVTKEVGKVTENLAKQVSETATRPTSVSSKGGKSHGEKSIAELEAELGFFN